MDRSVPIKKTGRLFHIAGVLALSGNSNTLCDSSHCHGLGHQPEKHQVHQTWTRLAEEECVIEWERRKGGGKED